MNKTHDSRILLQVLSRLGHFVVSYFRLSVYIIVQLSQLLVVYLLSRIRFPTTWACLGWRHHLFVFKSVSNNYHLPPLPCSLFKSITSIPTRHLLNIFLLDGLHPHSACKYFDRRVWTSLYDLLKHYLSIFWWKWQGRGYLLPHVIASIWQSIRSRFVRTRIAGIWTQELFDFCKQSLNRLYHPSIQHHTFYGADNKFLFHKFQKAVVGLITNSSIWTQML